MEDNLVTIDKILDWLTESIEHKRIIGAHTWVDACQKMNILLSEEHDSLFMLQQEIARMKVEYLDGDTKMSVAEAKLRVESSDKYREMQAQKAKIERVEEAIRISKIQARLKDNEYRSQ